METKDLVSDEAIQFALSNYGWRQSADEGRLMLLELLTKAGAGFYNSSTEEGFMQSFKLTKSNREPNKKGLRFIQSMIYASSHCKPACFDLMQKYRK